MHGAAALERALERMLKEATSRVGSNRQAEASALISRPRNMPMNSSN